MILIYLFYEVYEENKVGASFWQSISIHTSISRNVQIQGESYKIITSNWVLRKIQLLVIILYGSLCIIKGLVAFEVVEIPSTG